VAVLAGLPGAEMEEKKKRKKKKEKKKEKKKKKKKKKKGKKCQKFVSAAGEEKECSGSTRSFLFIFAILPYIYLTHV
jgi:hypothetical protein